MLKRIGLEKKHAKSKKQLKLQERNKWQKFRSNSSKGNKFRILINVANVIPMENNEKETKNSTSNLAPSIGN